MTLMMTKDQRAAARDPLAFAIRKLKQIYREEKSVTAAFALFDLKLTQARKPKSKPKKKKRKVYVEPGAFSKDVGDQGYVPVFRCDEWTRWRAKE